MNTDSNLFENVNTDTIHGVELYVLHLTALLETLFHLSGTRHCETFHMTLCGETFDRADISCQMSRKMSRNMTL